MYAAAKIRNTSRILLYGLYKANDNSRALAKALYNAKTYAKVMYLIYLWYCIFPVEMTVHLQCISYKMCIYHGTPALLVNFFPFVFECT